MKAPHAQRTISINGGEFSYFDWGGAGPLLHISHSIGLCAGVYTPFGEILKARFHVIALDSRGHGLTRAPADPGRLENWNILYEDLESFFEALDQPVIAVGHSMGGTLSLAAAVRRPELVRALIMIEPGLMPPSWAARISQLQNAGKADLLPLVSRTAERRKEWPDRASHRASVIEKESFRSWTRDFLEAYLEHVVDETGEGAVRLRCDPAWEARCIATAPADIWDYVPRLRTPTLVLYGERTQTFLPEVVERLRSEAPHVVIERFPTGHHVLMEAPQKSAEVVSAFLQAI